MFDVSVETTSSSVYFADEANDNYKICNFIAFFFPVSPPNGDRKLLCTKSQKDRTTRELCIRLLYNCSSCLLDFDDDPKNKIVTFKQAITSLHFVVKTVQRSTFFAHVYSIVTGCQCQQ